MRLCVSLTSVCLFVPHAQVEQGNQDVFSHMVSTADPVREMQPIPPPPDYPPPEAPALSEERQQQMLKAHELKTTWSDEHAKYYDSVSRHVFVFVCQSHLIQ